MSYNKDDLVVTFLRNAYNLIEQSSKVNTKQSNFGEESRRAKSAGEISMNLCQQNIVQRLAKGLKLQIYFERGQHDILVEYWYFKLENTKKGSKEISFDELNFRTDLAFNSVKCLVASRPFHFFLSNNCFSSSKTNYSSTLRYEIIPMCANEFWDAEEPENFTTMETDLFVYDQKVLRLEFGALDIDKIEIFFLQEGSEYIDWLGKDELNESVATEDSDDDQNLLLPLEKDIIRTLNQEEGYISNNSSIIENDEVVEKQEAEKDTGQEGYKELMFPAKSITINFSDDKDTFVNQKAANLNQNWAFMGLNPISNDVDAVDAIKKATTDLNSSPFVDEAAVCSQKLIDNLDSFYKELNA